MKTGTPRVIITKEQKFIFCPKCHRQVNFPFGNVKIEGQINLICACGNKVTVSGMSLGKKQ